uniref:Capsular polysaccharide synthesis protein n=1 Tax=Candidatus Kentrum sp. DK TaxID=2126562 RepID=A0A450RVX0_9GAMM|nr:MAG: Putative capsular polysaccharide synthesis protein [Candidatus Kentron sp. DK]
MKAELSDSLKEEVLRDFLLSGTITIQNSNIGAKKEYSALYREFLDRIRFQKEYTDSAYTSRYVNHFYTSDEMDAFRRKWVVF